MDIYLDIDGVLLANDAQAARYVDTFVHGLPLPINSL